MNSTICSTALDLIRATYKLEVNDYQDYESYRKDFEARMEHAYRLLDRCSVEQEEESSVCGGCGGEESVCSN